MEVTKRKEALKALVRRQTRQLIIPCRPKPAEEATWAWKKTVVRIARHPLTREVASTVLRSLASSIVSKK